MKIGQRMTSQWRNKAWSTWKCWFSAKYRPKLIFRFSIFFIKMVGKDVKEITKMPGLFFFFCFGAIGNKPLGGGDTPLRKTRVKFLICLMLLHSKAIGPTCRFRGLCNPGPQFSPSVIHFPGQRQNHFFNRPIPLMKTTTNLSVLYVLHNGARWRK